MILTAMRSAADGKQNNMSYRGFVDRTAASRYNITVIYHATMLK